MSFIRVEAPGLLTTVQDLGREGYGGMGVSPSGAADAISLRLANRLVGNPESAAGLEMTLLGGTFVFEGGAVAALAGADFGAHLDDASVETRSSFEIRTGQRLRLGATRSGARCYLSVCGGISVPSFLGSASTHVMSGLGGFEGRALRKGDVLRIGLATGSFRRRRIADHISEQLSRRGVLRVTRGPQADWFSERALRQFHSEVYRVGEQSDRMGLRLEGATALEAPARQMITEGVSLGAVQVPPGGSPIILSVNIACGGHAGDLQSMKATVEQALRHGVAVGAHPGYPDRANFGRIELDMRPEAIADSMFEQVQIFAEIAGGCGACVAHVKPHGALYNQAAKDRRIARAIADGVARWTRDITLVGLAGSTSLDVYREAGFRVAAEAFADRRYERDGNLRARKFDDALIGDPAMAAQQALQIVERGTVIACDRSEIPVNAQTICIHGDTPGAAKIAEAVVKALRQARFEIAPLSLIKMPEGK